MAHFTSIDFTRVLLDANIAISMDGKGSWRDNVFVERLWRSVKMRRFMCASSRSCGARVDWPIPGLLTAATAFGA